MRSPILVFLLSFAALWLSVKWGVSLRRRVKFLDEEQGHADFSVIQAATLTLLGIIIGFTFSMAVGRYDQRKSCEAQETNAIGTEYLRVELLPAPNAAAAKEELKKYLEQRIAWYKARDSGREQINHQTAQVKERLWSAVRNGVQGQPAGVVTLTVSGVNAVLDSQGYTEAAWLNRIPVVAWIMMETVALFGGLLLGIGAHRRSPFVLLALPFVVSVAFFLIADLESAGWGLIRVHPDNLMSLAESLKQP
jgi:hypothetical protein